MKLSLLLRYGLLLALAMALISCVVQPVAPAATGGETEAVPTEPEAAPAEAEAGPAESEAGEVWQVAMVTTGPTNDRGWNYDALRGVEAINKELGWDFAFSENVAQAEMANVLRQYAQQDYDLIFAHGYEWGDALEQVAPDFPDVMFAQINATVSGPNIIGTLFIYGELGYFTGMAAGLMSENGKIGIVAAQEAPQVTADTDTMQLAIKKVRPDADVSVSFVGSWDDVVKGQQVVQAQIDRGVDILIIMGNAFTPPAIELAKEKGIKVIPGWTIEGYELAPDTVITSGVQEIPGLYVGLAKKLQDGELEGNQNYSFGFADGAQFLGKWGDFVPEDVKAQVNQAIEDYLAGTLDIGLK